MILIIVTIPIISPSPQVVVVVVVVEVEVEVDNDNNDDDNNTIDAIRYRRIYVVVIHFDVEKIYFLKCIVYIMYICIYV